MSRNLFCRVPLWDFQAFFEAVKLRGRKTGQYYYCEACGDYLSDQYGFEFSMKKWVCKKCGEVNELSYTSPAGSGSDVAKCTELQVSQTCPVCGKRADGMDEMIAVFGFEKDISGHIVPKEVCKSCRGKELFSYGKK
ncbi:MAG: hypothetical protein IJ324_02195 [Lachnospiraceae bacterium]|nr:hypothetical protein [Lachnospiraceae bacterium]